LSSLGWSGYQFSDWSFAFTSDTVYPAWMDFRHAFFLYRLVCLGMFRNILEVGCYDGASTSAFLQAINDGHNFHLTLCEPYVRPVLVETVSRCNRKPTLVQRDSLNVIDKSFDLVLVDGDHRTVQVAREVGLCLFHDIATIVAHDTSAFHIPGCEGSVFLGKVFKNHPDFCCLEDNLKRDGEFTERGFLFATKNKQLFEEAKPIWHEIMGSKKEDLPW
jgi:hypothetical protein